MMMLSRVRRGSDERKEKREKGKKEGPREGARHGWQWPGGNPQRFPYWEVDFTNYQARPTSTVRGGKRKEKKGRKRKGGRRKSVDPAVRSRHGLPSLRTPSDLQRQRPGGSKRRGKEGREKVPLDISENSFIGPFFRSSTRSRRRLGRT